MKPFNKAWLLLKALSEQQGFMMSRRLPTMYGEDLNLPSFQRRTGTIAQPILGLMRRRQSNHNAHAPFPDRRVRDYSESDFMEDNIKYGTIIAQGPRKLMTGEPRDNDPHLREDDDWTDAAQRKRGSVFDAGHYNRFGYPMVGVAQGYDFSDFSPEYRVSNYNKLPE